MNSAFYGCGTTSLTFNISSWSVTKVTDFTNAFRAMKCSFDPSAWVINTTSSVNMNYMFADNTYLTSLDLSGWDVSKVTSFDRFVEACTNLTTIGDTSSWDTSSVTGQGFLGMFSKCSSLLSVDVSGWDVSHVTTFGVYWGCGMFQGCSSLTEIAVSSWVLNTSVNIETLSIIHI